MKGVYAYFLSENISIRKFLVDHPENLITEGPFDLFFGEENRFMYVTSYGAVSFAGFGDEEIHKWLLIIKAYADDPLKTEYKEDFRIETGYRELKITGSALWVQEYSPEMIRLVMLALSQSVALDYYTARANELMGLVLDFTRTLEKRGRFGTSKSKLLRLIGATLNVRNQLVDNLYIYDTPDIVWENELLEKIYLGINENFDLKKRFQEIDYTLRIVENNLNTFSTLLQNKESTFLELIIVFLILFEILYSFFGK